MPRQAWARASSLAVALAVAGGGEMFGWKAQQARKVLFVDDQGEGW